MRRRTVAITAVMVGFMAAGCTNPEKHPNVDPSNPSPSSMTFEEAYQKVPIDGVGDLKIHWDVPPAADTGEVLAARRSLAYNYWLPQATDWNPIIPLGRYLFTEWWYQKVLAGFETNAGSDDPSIGPIWVKFMGVDKLAPDQTRVTFCTDIGWWHETSENNPQVRKNRANLESLIMHNVPTGDGERHWLTNQHFNPADDEREAKYGAECTKWARHEPPAP